MRAQAHRPSRLVLGLVLVALAGSALAACSDSPSDVVEDLGEYAENRKLVQFRRSFSDKATRALQRQFREDGLQVNEGWRDLMVGYLGKDKEPPEVVEEVITGESDAVVKVAKTLEPPKGSKDPERILVQELALVKEDEQWKLDLGPMRYEIKDAEGDEEEEKPEKPLAAEEDDDFGGLGGKKKEDKKVEDIDLEDF